MFHNFTIQTTLISLHVEYLIQALMMLTSLTSGSPAHLPSATMRPLESVPDPLLMPSENGAEQERIAYFIQPLGGPSGVAKLYLEAGLLH